MEARAIFFTGIGKVEVRPVTIPDPGPGEVLIATDYSAISPGTELRCLAGQQPGAADWPYIPGYALTGRVVAGGADTTLAPGTPVFCGGTTRAEASLMWGGHVSHAVRPEASVLPVAEPTSLLDAALAKLAGIALHGLRLARVSAGQQVAVLGLGPLGQLSARLAHSLGAEVVGYDLVEARAALARQHGVVATAGEPGLAAAIHQAFPTGPDVIIDATGSVGVMSAAIDVARDLPWDDGEAAHTIYVVQGSYARDIAIPYQAAFMKELTFTFPRDAQPRDLRQALALLGNGQLVTRDLISLVSAPDQAPAVYAELRAHPEALMVAAFGWAELPN